RPILCCVSTPKQVNRLRNYWTCKKRDLGNNVDFARCRHFVKDVSYGLKSPIPVVPTRSIVQWSFYHQIKRFRPTKSSLARSPPTLRRRNSPGPIHISSYRIIPMESAARN